MNLALVASSAQLFLLAIVVITLLASLLAINRWGKIPAPKLLELSENANPPKITLVLPTWNEAKVIEGKLEGIKSQNYPHDLLEVIIIDACSSDSTIELVKAWLKRNNLEGSSNYRIIEEDERRGKSVSINRAFSEARPESEILMMSDVDCRLSEGAILKISRWFSDSSIGAVSGSQILLNPNESVRSHGEASYRDFFNKIRTAESHLISTPIFHGECSAYRRDAIAGHQLVENSNADDSQMAVCAVRSGYRSIYDPEISFFEMAPQDGKNSRLQKVRRAQGLVRHFWRNKMLIVDRKFGEFRKVMALEFSLHIILPILVTLGFLVGFFHIGLVIYGTPLESEAFYSLHPVEKTMLIADLIVILLLSCGYFGIPLPASRISFTFYGYMLSLIRAQALIIGGKSLHKWDQVTSVRDALSNYDRLP